MKKQEQVWSTTDFMDEFKEFNLDLGKSNGYQPRFSYSSTNNNSNSSFFSNHLNNISNSRKDLTLTNGTNTNGHSTINETTDSSTTMAMKLKQNQGSFTDVPILKTSQNNNNNNSSNLTTTIGNGTLTNGFGSSPKIVVKEVNQPIKSNNTHSLYVAGLYKGLSQAELKKYFEKFGKIEKVTVPAVVDNIVDGQKYLFIRFEECSSVDKILQQDYHTIKDISVRTKPGKNV